MNISRKFVFNSLEFGSKAVSVVIKDFNKRYMSLKSFDIIKEKEKMLDAWPTVIENLAKHPKFEELPVAKDWMKKVLNNNVPNGKVLRGITTVMAYKLIEKPENVTEETIRLVYTLGWCVEMLQGYCTVLDDIADGSSTRRGMPCWYQREGVGIGHAINDASLIYSCLHQLLNENFNKSSFYVSLFQAFNKTLFYTSIGQFLDIEGSQHGPIKNYDLFTKEYYDDIIIHKSSYYTFNLPISIGLMLANHASKENLRYCEEISLQLGRLFQMQDDYLDCFGDELFIGKIGTDIQEGKCTWLAVNALPRCGVKSRTVFAACYGSKEPAHVERIKQLYIQLQIPQLYKEEEQELYNNIKQKIDELPSTTERGLYRKILDVLYNRKK